MIIETQADAAGSLGLSALVCLLNDGDGSSSQRREPEQEQLLCWLRAPALAGFRPRGGT